MHLLDLVVSQEKILLAALATYDTLVNLDPAGGRSLFQARASRPPLSLRQTQKQMPLPIDVATH